MIMSGNSQIAENENLYVYDNKWSFLYKSQKFWGPLIIPQSKYIPTKLIQIFENLQKSNKCMHFMSNFNIVTGIPLYLQLSKSD